MRAKRRQMHTTYDMQVLAGDGVGTKRGGYAVFVWREDYDQF